MTSKAYCQCKVCRKKKRKGLVLGSYLTKHLGAGARLVSAYVRHPRWGKGRRPDDKFSD